MLIKAYIETTKSIKLYMYVIILKHEKGTKLPNKRNVLHIWLA